MKSAIFNLVRASHTLLAMRSLPRRLGLCFHELEPDQYPQFRAAIQYLKAHGYRCVTPAELVDDCDEEAGDRLLLVTFDDNYRCWHQALPLLDELDVQATFYVNTLPFRDLADAETITAYYDRNAFQRDRVPLTRRELVEIRASGHVIGCHTHSHFDLGRLPQIMWDSEIAQNKTMLENIIGEEVVDFSWPYGMRRNFNEDLRAYCASIGLKRIAASTPGLLHTTAIDPLNIPRTRWLLDKPLEHNLVDVRVDGRLFESITGRSAVG
ncbi:MAG: polysaccharide deacetylase family protein [Rhizobiales bacterium]|nr:polysaccharide deacetylase family protein [Hyphomicrobiales bacterium]